MSILQENNEMMRMRIVFRRVGRKYRGVMNTMFLDTGILSQSQAITSGFSIRQMYDDD